jgi:hypothetical protein
LLLHLLTAFILAFLFEDVECELYGLELELFLFLIFSEIIIFYLSFLSFISSYDLSDSSDDDEDFSDDELALPIFCKRFYFFITLI